MSKNKELLYETMIIVLFIALITVVALIGFVLYKEISASNTLECREGKLFKVTHEGNITIYDPTYDDCEVTQ